MRTYVHDDKWEGLIWHSLLELLGLERPSPSQPLLSETGEVERLARRLALQ
jgi:hypothetical protein